MPDIHVLTGRIESPEKPSSGAVRFFVQYLLSPLLVIAIGAVFIHQLDEAKQSFRRLELEVKRIEATRGFLTELFSGSPQRAFIAERLSYQIVEDKLAGEISSVVKDYYLEKIEDSIARQDIQAVNNIQEAARAIPSRASGELVQALRQPSFYVVVASVPSEEDAISKARELRTKNFKSEVVLDTKGRYEVTLGRYSFDEAKAAKQKAVESGAAPADAYIMTRANVVSQAF
jgi:hypothetical protein